jgi:hypothetical protein
MRLSHRESRDIHDKDNQVYYHPKVGFYTVTWIETGSSDIPQINPINTGGANEQKSQYPDGRIS